MEEAARGKTREEEETNESQNAAVNNNNNTRNPPSDAPISMSELSKRMHCPINYKVTLPFLYGDDGEAKQTPGESLSHIPWRLRIEKDSDEPLQTGGGASNTSTEENLIFSSWTYLELRRQQNVSWASGRLKEGNELLFINPTRAETKFLEGLDLVPDHVDLLTAYAKLLMTHNNDLKAAETKLKRALEIDPNHQLAQKTKLELVRIQQGRILLKQQQEQHFFQHQDVPLHGDFLANRNVQVAKKGNGIYSDVLMERALMGNDDDDDNKGDMASRTNDDDSSSSSRRRRKSKRDKKRKKKKKKHKRKRKRRYYSSESDDDNDSRSSRSGSSMEGGGEGDAPSDKGETDNDGKEDDTLEKEEKEKDDNDSRDNRRHRKDRKRRKRHRKRRRRRYYSSEDDNSSRRSVSPTNGERENGDVQTSKGGADDTGKLDNDQEKTEKEERSDDASREEGRHHKDTKRRRHRDDRKHRSRKKSRRHDSSS